MNTASVQPQAAEITLRIDNANILPSLKKILKAIDGVTILPQKKHTKKMSGVDKALQDIQEGRVQTYSSLEELIADIEK